MTPRVDWSDIPDEVPRPDVTACCKRCRVEWYDVARGAVIVSPQGRAHFGEEYGETFCGIDATRAGWWWPV